MDDFTYILLVAYGVAIGVVLLVIFLDRLDQVWTQYLLRIVTSIAVVWALSTCWMWFYLLALWLSLPAFVTGLLLTTYIVQKYGWSRPARVFAVVLALAFILNVISFVFFYF